MNKHYKLIIGHSFSLSNETDYDVQSDYFPGIWGIKTQKSAMRFAKELLAEGDTITVTDYDNPNHHALANKFITELGLKQPLFAETPALPTSSVTNGKPATLGALKKYLQVGTKIRIVSSTNPANTRNTEVLQTKNESVVTRKGETGQSHLYFGKATDWTFDNLGATFHFLDKENGYYPSFRIEYDLVDYGKATVDALNRANI